MHNPSAPSQGHNQKPQGTHPFPSNGLARQGKPSRSGRQPAKPIGPHSPTAQQTRPAGQAGPGGSPQTPQGLTHPTAQQTRPAGQTQQVRAAARKNPKGPTSLSVQRPSPGRASLAEFPRPQAGKENGNHVLTGSAGQNIPLTPRVPASPARVGVHPPILGGATGQAEHPTPPYTALPNEAPTFRAPPKIPYLIRILGSIY